MSLLSNVSRARRAIFTAALVGLGLIGGAQALAQDEAVTTEEEDANQPLLMKRIAGTEAGKQFIDTDISINGYVQGSYTKSFSSPPGDVIDGRGLDFENDEVNLNGIGLSLEREIEANSEKFDIGFGVDLLYGTDARFTKSNGLLDHQGFVFDGTGDGPENQLDITQAYVQFALPVGNGLLVTAGKFVTPIGYEYVDPRGNLFFSHGFLFNFGAPFSHTGVIGRYNVSDDLFISAGITRGWDQSLEDNNNYVDFLGVVEYTPDEQWNFALAISSGPQQDDDDSFRTVLDLLVTYELNEKWSFGLEALYGVEADIPGSNEDYSQFYGIALYKSYKICPATHLNGRFEWFSDQDLVRGVGSEHVFSVTAGLDIRPLAHTDAGDALRIRPELRWDVATEDPAFDGGTDYDQLTFAVDVVFAY